MRRLCWFFAAKDQSLGRGLTSRQEQGTSRESLSSPFAMREPARDSLPPPLLFFQALDVRAKDFGVRVIGDLARHLGYARTPAIRYEEMTADLESALSHIEQESEISVVEELGFVDCLVAVHRKD